MSWDEPSTIAKAPTNEDEPRLVPRLGHKALSLKAGSSEGRGPTLPNRESRGLDQRSDLGPAENRDGPRRAFREDGSGILFVRLVRRLFGGSFLHTYHFEQ